MSKNIRLGIALVIIVGAIFWAYNSTQQRSYSGSRLTFAVGSGSVVITNTGSGEIPVSMRADGRSANFRVASNDFDLSLSSRRQGSGRNAYHSVEFNLPVGQSVIDVTRGGSVQFVSTSSTRLTAVVTPKSPDEAQTTYVITIFITLAALFFISHTTEHQWIGYVRSKLPIDGIRPKRMET